MESGYGKLTLIQGKSPTSWIWLPLLGCRIACSSDLVRPLV
jgi:hypothetical protein